MKLLKLPIIFLLCICLLSCGKKDNTGQLNEATPDITTNIEADNTENEGINQTDEQISTDSVVQVKENFPKDKLPLMDGCVILSCEEDGEFGKAGYSIASVIEVLSAKDKVDAYYNAALDKLGLTTIKKDDNDRDVKIVSLKNGKDVYKITLLEEDSSEEKQRILLSYEIN